MKSLPAPVQRWLTLLLPPLSLLICCAVMVPRQNRLRRAEKQILIAQAGVQTYLAQLKAISDLPPNPTVASLPATREEQSAFLRDLAGRCASTGNHILSVTALAAAPEPPPPPPGTPAPPGALSVGLPADVTAIKSTIMFEGGFRSLRAFLRELHASQRLVSLTECRVGAGQAGFPTLATTLTVTRYVDALTPGAVAPPNASGDKVAAPNASGDRTAQPPQAAAKGAPGPKNGPQQAASPQGTAPKA